jgi:regulator of protease activity HflC (stomatin/prohibitin superfamily)
MISAGQVGVALLFGKVQPVVLHEGINLVNPLYDVVEMNTRVLRHQAKYDAASKDLQAVHVEMVLNYRLLPDKAAEVYQRIGPNFASVIIDPAAQEVLKANTALHVATEILHQRPKIKTDIQGELTTWLAKYGIEVKEAALANIKFDPAYEKAIEGKQIEEQKAEQKRYELVQAQRQAEIVAAQAKGQGDAAREKAKGEAEATKIRADAESTYNQKVSASLTPTLIQQRYLEKWDGKLPQFSMGSGGNAPGLMLNMPMPAPAKP